MIVETTRGFYSVEHPETGETIRVDEPFETDRETFELLRGEYSGFRVVEDGSTSGNTQGSRVEDGGVESGTSEDDYTCGVNDCSRSVDSLEDVCWQHEPQDGET